LRASVVLVHFPAKWILRFAAEDVPNLRIQSQIRFYRPDLARFRKLVAARLREAARAVIMSFGTIPFCKLNVTARGMRGAWAKATFCAWAIGLAGCAPHIAPYVDSRREAGKQIMVGPSNLDVVAICYGGSKEPPPAAVKLAESECAKTDRVPRLERRKRIACSMLAPTRAYFRCEPKPSPEAHTGG
jgi:hypothetical protein